MYPKAIPMRYGPARVYTLVYICRYTFVTSSKLQLNIYCFTFYRIIFRLVRIKVLRKLTFCNTAWCLSAVGSTLCKMGSVWTPIVPYWSHSRRLRFYCTSTLGIGKLATAKSAACRRISTNFETYTECNQSKLYSAKILLR